MLEGVYGVGGLSMGSWGNRGVGGRVSPKGCFCALALLRAAQHGVGTALFWGWKGENTTMIPAGIGVGMGKHILQPAASFHITENPTPKNLAGG